MGIQQHYKEKNRGLYTVLSKDNISKTFKKWSDLCEHYNRRHKVAHRGIRINSDDAKKSLCVVASFIKHIENMLKLSQPLEEI